MHDNSESPTAYDSRSLTKSEANYSQIDMEATAIFRGLKKYFNYCYGRQFILLTDHKGLKSIFKPRKDLPAMSATRMLHYAQFLSGFNYKIRYRSTNEHKNADFFSRFPLPSSKDESKVNEITCFQIRQTETLPLTRTQLKRATQHDPYLQQIYNSLLSGTASSDLEQNYTLHDGCILHGIRVVISTILRHQVLQELHVGHMGISKMKALARTYCFWRGIDSDIEQLARSCKN
jgi:hypothetical protein